MSDTQLSYEDLSDLRYNPFTDEYSPKQIGYGANSPEVRTIPNSSPYIIKLFEAPQRNTPTTTEITLVSTSEKLVEVSKTTALSNKRFRVNYDEKDIGKIEFHPNQKGLQVSIKYYGLGTIMQTVTLDSTFARQILETNQNLLMKMKVLEIGDWNMDANASVTIPHGLTRTKVRAVKVIVRNDANTASFDLSMAGNLADPDLLNGGFNNMGNVSITLVRRTGGQFDSVNYDSTSYNRGWVVIWYEN
jgi:hypothetical protein